MGYILPVTHYSYQNYHRRIVESKSSPHTEEAPVKAFFPKISSIEDFYREKPSLERTTMSKERQYYINKVYSQEEAELTGKGLYFHAYV